ncbi:hypothetical protein [Promicromonospora sp. MEB111]|uniref:hypothetical protein n=1 Tax=Promicromonospora sp. MEB111 TaxID=3040301 RepID=UPI00254AC055|nr:hypothetical protein [Promicromonospora sp. MEB111]
MNKVPSGRRLTAAGLLTAVAGALSVAGCSWVDGTDECAEALAEHRVLLLEEANALDVAQGAPALSCDDTGGPPAYAVFDLEPRAKDGLDDLLARHGWECAEHDDEEGPPGLVCTKAVEGVPLELLTSRFLNGAVEVWVYADPPWTD